MILRILNSYYRADRVIFLGIVLVLMVAVGVLYYTDGGETPDRLTAADSLRGDYPPHSYQPYQVEGRRVERFPFDPNTADSTQLLRLGLQPWQVRNIYKYRARGGVYRRPQDFARLYGLTQKQYRELEPYIRISDDYQPAALLVDEQTSQRDTLKYPVKVTALQSVNVNTTDTMQLRKVPGVGEAFARRIIRYGQRLGGYVSSEQLREIEDFPDSAVRYFRVEPVVVRKLAVNRLTLQQLQRHPYISFYQAKAIIDYRRLHGPLHSLQDLSLNKDFPADAIRRLEPYVEF